MSDITVRKKMMRIYLGEDDEYNGQPLYHAIVLRLQELGMAGATVYKGIEGYGGQHRLRKAKTFVLSGDLPVTVVTVDAPAKIKRVLPEIARMMKDGIIALLEVEVVTVSGGEIVTEN